MRLLPPKGTRDFYPAEMAIRRHIERAWREASTCFGFEEIDGPTFEHLELYTLKSGQGIVDELFSFRRAGGENDYALRPEFTPTLARMVAARAAQLPMPVKWFAMPAFFRAERPQRGRLREFLQWNVDLLGVEGPAVDAEVIGVAVAALERLGLTPTDVRVKISHRVAAASLVQALGVAAEQVPAAFELLDRRDKMPPEEFAKRATALGLHDRALADFLAAVEAVVPLADGGEPTPLERLPWAGRLDAAQLETLRALQAALVAAGLGEWCDIDLGIVRGLAYYTGTVFEIHEASGAERAIAGGGRYDGLVELFGGPRTPAMGFGMGDVVLGLVLADRNLLPKDATALLPRPDAFVISNGEPAAEAALARVVASLRRAGLHVRHTYKTTRNVGKLLSEASRARSRTAVILECVGQEAGGAGTLHAQLKNLDSGEQRRVELSELAAALRAAGGGAGGAGAPTAGGPR
ncbi:MAG: histidine--tRNA ligase [Phycisphaerales bacterium]